MIYYKRYMGDFERDTGHLSLTEIGAYDRLLDHYYSQRQPLPDDLPAIYRIARAMTDLEQQAVQTVICRFFTKNGTTLHNKRADAEIAKWQELSKRNREIALARESTKRATSCTTKR